MDTKRFNTYDEMCRVTAEEIIEDLKANPGQMLCIAAGHTSLGVFTHLIRAYEDGRADFSRAWFTAMDEWLGMNETTPGSCGNFLVENFLSQVNYPPAHVRLWDGKAGDTDQECRDVTNFIAENAASQCIDYLVLGCGMNGHLALNEPGTVFDAGAHVCPLDPLTADVGQKYFDNGANLTGGITLGIGDFRRARRTVLLINGERKAGILSRILQAPKPDPAIPATALQLFPNASLYYDAAAGQPPEAPALK